MSDSHLFDSTPVPPTGHALLGFDSSPCAVRATASRGCQGWFSSRHALRWAALLALSIAGCAEDRHIKFCDPGLPPNPDLGGCPAAGAGGGGAGGTGGGVAGVGGGGFGGIGGIGGSGGLAGSGGGAGAPGGTGGGVTDLDASAPSPDAGEDAGDDAG